MLNIRQRLLLLQCGTVLATSVFLGALSYSLFIPTIFKLQKQHLQQVSSSAAKDLQSHLKKLSQTLEAIDLEHFHSKYGDLPIEELFVRHFDKLSASFPVISYLDRDGNETVHLINTRPSEHFHSYHDSPLVAAANADPNKAHIGILQQEVHYQQAALQLAITRIGYFGDEFIGTLLVTLPLADLAPFLQTTPQDDGLFLSLIDERQRVLFSPDATAQFTTLSEQLPGTPDRYQLLGQDLFVASTKIEPLDWQVISAIPHAQFVRELTNLKILSTLTCILVALLSGALVLRLVRHLTANIDLLIKHTEEVGSGNLDHHLELYQDQEFLKLGTAFNAMTRDIARYHNSRDSLQQILQSIIDPLVVADQQGNIQQVNHATLELFACEENQLLGQPIVDLFPEPPEMPTDENFTAALLRRRASNLETHILTFLGRRVAVLFSSSPVPGRNSDIGVVGIIKDVDELVTARIAREHALREAEEAHRNIDALLKSVADGLLVTDLSGKVLRHNQSAEELLGHPQQATFKQVLESLPDPTQVAVFNEPYDISLPASENSLHRIVQVHSSPVLDHRGSQTGMISVLRDVTRERALEQIKTEFISTAAHELTTPLTSILGYSELLLDRELEGNFSVDQKRDFMEEILGRSESLSRIVDDLLNISRIEAGRSIPLEIVPTAVEPLLEKIVGQFQLANKQHRFELKQGAAPSQVLIDPEKIRQVLENLLSNAVKYSPDSGTIAIESLYEQGRYRLQITDQGIGMTKEEQARVFDKFYRADSSNTAVSGLGLGMCIVQQIVEGHRGEISVTSKLGEGTTVTLFLPLTDQIQK